MEAIEQDVQRVTAPPTLARTHQSRNRVYVLEVTSRTDPSAGLVGIVLVQRSESYERNPKGEVVKASIELEYQQIWPPTFSGPQSGAFTGWFKPYENKVSITGGAVELLLERLKGHRIGTYLFSQVVAWAKQWPDTPVARIRVTSVDGAPHNLERRNRLYENVIPMEYRDAENKEGHSRACLAGDLIVHSSWRQNIREVALSDAIGTARTERETLAIQIDRLQQAKAWATDAMDRARRTPVIWALQQVVTPWSPHWFLGAGVAVGAAGMWWLRNG